MGISRPRTMQGEDVNVGQRWINSAERQHSGDVCVRRAGLLCRVVVQKRHPFQYARSVELYGPLGILI